jgi:heme-degrading monooxygenase HmoA
MTVRVLMRRKVPEEKLGALRELLDKMRLQAMDQTGYVSGETLKRLDTPGFRLVISKWKSLREWQMWFDSPKRKAVQEQIDALLGEPTDYEIYDYD